MWRSHTFNFICMYMVKIINCKKEKKTFKLKYSTKEKLIIYYHIIYSSDNYYN